MERYVKVTDEFENSAILKRTWSYFMARVT